MSRSGSARGRYRPALDGVRAIAVLAVIAYHVNWPLHGGFLGVDIFFVLSGYLITTLLLRERDATGSVSLTNFWARRARRLFPAVLLLLAACIAETAHSGSIVTYSARRADIVSTLFYYANWHFIATDQSYFATYAGVSPLRHMWSLAIEEQFYLLWPATLLAMLYLLRRHRRAVLLALGLLVTASAVLMAVRYTAINPSRSYFGTDTRVHVLLVGAILAVLVHRRSSLLDGAAAARWSRRSAPAIVVLVLGALVFVHDQDPFYYRGGSLLFAIVVAAGLWAIEAAPDAAPGRALSLRPVRWIGAISYGLYLWHWPMIVWIGRSRVIPAGLPRDLAEVAAAFALATLSFYLVERPVRAGRVPWLGMSKPRLAAVAAVSAALVVAATLKTTHLANTDFSDTPCPPGSPQSGGLSWCVRVSPTAAAAPTVATAGDSTSRALDPGMRQVAGRRTWRYLQVGQSGCSLLPLTLPNSLTSSEMAQQRNCVDNVPKTIADAIAQYHPRVWIIADRFPLNPLVTSGHALRKWTQTRSRIIGDSLVATVRQMLAGGGQVVIVGVAPPGPPAECGASSTEAKCTKAAYSTANKPTQDLNNVYRRVAAEFPGRVVYISVDDVLCPDRGHCPATIDGVLARFDGIHYTGTFSRVIVPTIIDRAERHGVSFRGGRTLPRGRVKSAPTAG